MRPMQGADGHGGSWRGGDAAAARKRREGLCLPSESIQPNTFSIPPCRISKMPRSNPIQKSRPGAPATKSKTRGNKSMSEFKDPRAVASEKRAASASRREPFSKAAARSSVPPSHAHENRAVTRQYWLMKTDPDYMASETVTPAAQFCRIITTCQSG